MWSSSKLPHSETLVCIYADGYTIFALTALFNRLVREVPTVTLLIAHFIDADALPTAALESVRIVTFTHWRQTRASDINPY